MDQAFGDLIIAGVSFSDTAIEVTYFQKSSQAPGVQLVEVMTIDIDENLEGLAQEILDNLRELVDSGLLRRRNPPRTLQPKF